MTKAEIRGYAPGPIAAEAAFTSDFAIPDHIPMEHLATMIEVERPSMDIRPGMRNKYTPFRFDPATGQRQVGGRYLFDTWSNVLDYERFTTEEVEFEKGVKFWDRPFFLGVDRHVWRVVGAHDLAPLATSHHVNRFERWTYDHTSVEKRLTQAWPSILEHANDSSLTSIWLMFQPEEKQIAILSVAARGGDENIVAGTERAIGDLARKQSWVEKDRTSTFGLGMSPLFDRTSAILAMWLPQSRALGGRHSAYPNAPLYPEPRLDAPVPAR